MLNQQAGALCWVGHKVVLVSHDNGKQWTIPHGAILKQDKSPAYRAETQAWDEAGVLGPANSSPVGEFLCSRGGKIYRVEVFTIKKCKVRKIWPQSVTAIREMFTPAEAAEKVSEFGLRDILTKYAKAKR